MLTAVKGTLVPMQFHFLEGDLEKLWKAKGIEDMRHFKQNAKKVFTL